MNESLESRVIKKWYTRHMTLLQHEHKQTFKLALGAPTPWIPLLRGELWRASLLRGSWSRKVTLVHCKCTSRKQETNLQESSLHLVHLHNEKVMCRFYGIGTLLRSMQGPRVISLSRYSYNLHTLHPHACRKLPWPGAAQMHILCSEEFYYWRLWLASSHDFQQPSALS